MKRLPASHAAVMRLACVIVAACLGGCAATPPRPPRTAVAYRTIDAADAQHYQLREDEVSTLPTAIAAATPDYPAAMVGRGLAHVAVRALVIVDASGRVDDVRIEPAAAPHPVEFDDAVHLAVSQWRYLPLRIQQWEEVLDAQGNVIDSRLSVDQAKPFSLTYEFSFDLRDGKPVVRSTQTVLK